MGNTIMRNRVERNPAHLSGPRRPKVFWHLGRLDKVRAAGSKQDGQKKLAVHYMASQHYQENVFIESSSRSQYLQDLHSEAQMGLKVQQQEERNGLTYQDNQTESAVIPQLERDSSPRDRDGSPESGNTSRNSLFIVSSTRPALTRQGSTFKPLNQTKKLDRTKRRGRRTTIMGIPQHVHMELSMQKGVHTLPNGKGGNSPEVVVIPTTDGEMSTINVGARVHLQKDLLKHHMHDVCRDNCGFSQRPNMQRPKSLALPGLISPCFLQEPPGPVMSVSPQATYLSKIIPNAVLPAVVDVMKINRRQSMRTVSKSSLTSGSSASSHSEGSTQDGPSSTSSRQSHSRSSETIVSNSSTISSKESCVYPPRDSCVKEASDQMTEDQVLLWRATNSSRPRSKDGNGLVSSGESARSSRSFSRSLSVMKTKHPPAPPRRTYSLHHEKIKQRSQELSPHLSVSNSGSLEVSKDQDLGEENMSSVCFRCPTNSAMSSSLDKSKSSITSTPLSPDQPSTGDQTESNFPTSLHKVPAVQGKFERTVSPSSGYSSRSGTPTLSPKEMCSPSPGKEKVQSTTAERTGSYTSPTISASSITSLGSVESETLHQDTSQVPKVPSPAVLENPGIPAPLPITLRNLLNIPPPPKVKAPSPPPPETWAHNKRTIELLCGPGPDLSNINQLQKNQQKNKAHKQRQEAQRTNENEPIIAKTSSHDEGCEEKASHSETKDNVKEDTTIINIQDQMNGSVNKYLNNMNRKVQDIIKKGERRKEESLKVEVQKRTDFKKSPVISKKETPMVVKKNLTMQNGGNPQVPTIKVKAEIEVTPLDEDKTFSSLTVEERLIEYLSCPEHTTMDTSKTDHTYVLSTEKHTGVSPPHSPPPAYPPPPPPTKTHFIPMISTPTEEDLVPMESTWPPPPPPMQELSELVFDVHDDLDFPPPPPPCYQETLVNSDTQDTLLIIITKQGHSLESKGEETDGLPQVQPVNLQMASNEEQCSNSVQTCHQTTRVTVNVATSGASSLIKGSPPQQEAFCLQPIELASTSSPDLPSAEGPLIFRRPSGQKSNESQSKELLSRIKSVPVPVKDDANIPLVTPSLLQMVRLRSIASNIEGQVKCSSQEKTPSTENTSFQSPTPGHVIPQKPIRKSLCMKSPCTSKSPAASVTSPSMCLQEAVRMKMAALSSRDGLPVRRSLHSPNNDLVLTSPKSLDGTDLHKSPASTASFIFSKNTKRVVIETPSSPEAQTDLQQSLVAELTQFPSQAKAVVIKKVPPPIAKKPIHGIASEKTILAIPTGAGSFQGDLQEPSVVVDTNGETETMQPAGQQAQTLQGQESASREEVTTITDDS
uniref:KIAA1522 n=1 Tax=Denticeps clupeoides TaxID=299321 RepID=A0AAY4CDG0_9TELE